MPALELLDADRQEIVAAVTDLVTAGVVPIAHFKDSETVHHLNYFQQPETVEGIRKHFKLTV